MKEYQQQMHQQQVVQCLSAEGVLDTGSVGNTTGEFIGNKGFVSEDQMRIQDSYYYQDFSYVIKIGESINEWRDSIKTATHPAGFQVFGQVVSTTRIYGGCCYSYWFRDFWLHW